MAEQQPQNFNDDENERDSSNEEGAASARRNRSRLPERTNWRRRVIRREENPAEAQPFNRTDRRSKKCTIL